VLRPSQHIGNAPAFKAHVFDHGPAAGALPIMPKDFLGWNQTVTRGLL